MKTTIIYKGRLPSLNDVIDKNRANKYAGSKQKKEVQRLLSHCIKSQCRSRFNRIVISFKWYEPNRKRDFDNVASATKFILDALVQCDVIPNDGWDNIEPRMVHELFHDKENPRVEIEIEGVEI
jgi:Holliday junction resolvase RusA-like endonuclease